MGLVLDTGLDCLVISERGVTNLLRGGHLDSHHDSRFFVERGCDRKLRKVQSHKMNKR